MATNVESTVFRLCDLPPELILDIAHWAQRIWHEGILSFREPALGTRRHFVSLQRFPTRVEHCCHGSDYNTIRGCLSQSTLAVAPSPAHSMSQAGKGLRDLLLDGNNSLWKLDNTFYKAIAERPGVGRFIGAPNAWNGPIIVTYPSRTLVAENVCSCFILGIETFLASLEVMKIALPWGGPVDETRGWEDSLMSGEHLSSSPLRHLDIELYHSRHADDGPVIDGALCPALLTCRCINVSSFLYSPVMTHLFIQHPVDRRPRFNSLLTDALLVCASSLESLTIDTCEGRFLHFDNVTLPRLRFFRLVAPSHYAYGLLRHLTLPAEVELHLEPVVNWRRQHAGSRSYVARLESQEADVQRLWRYAGALAFPDRMAGIFQTPATVPMEPPGVWLSLRTVALNIRLDASTTATERACARFPEYVGLAFARTVTEMKSFLSVQRRAWYPMNQAPSQTSGIKSLAARDTSCGRQMRDFAYNPRLVKPLYDVVRHVIHTAISGRPGTAYAGLPGVRHLVVHPESFMPAFSLGWAHILDDFLDIEDLIILCAGVPQGTVFTDNMEGCLDIAHLDALGLYLNGKDNGAYPCPFLRRIELPSYTAALDGGPIFVAGVEAKMNSVLRVEVLGRRIAVTCS